MKPMRGWLSGGVRGLDAFWWWSTIECCPPLRWLVACRVHRRRVIRTSLRATLTVNPRRVSMGLSRLPSPVLSSTHACEWSWWRFTFRFLAFLATTVTLWIHFLRYGFKNATEHYSLCNLGNLLRQVLWVLLLSALREFLESNSQAQYL